jgi:hypothetical protein
MTKLFNKCPACGGRIVLTECRCASCDLQLRGDFQLGPFAHLSEDQMAFVRVFLLARGNLTEVERTLGISYPTIRNKLDEINSALSEASQAKAATPQIELPAVQKPAGSEDDRREILKKVASGQFTPAEALEQLQKKLGEKR